MKQRVIGILTFVMITQLAFAVACSSTDSDDELTELTEEKKYNYIQLPPEMTSWSEEKDDGSSVSDARVIRDNQPYRLTQEEYHRIMDDGESIDKVLADRENWAAQWKGYASVKIEGESDLNEFPSKYFYDKNHNLSSGYNHYIAGNISDPITNLVPTVKFSWG